MLTWFIVSPHLTRQNVKQALSSRRSVLRIRTRARRHTHWQAVGGSAHATAAAAAASVAPPLFAGLGYNHALLCCGSLLTVRHSVLRVLLLGLDTGTNLAAANTSVKGQQEHTLLQD